MSEPVVVGAFAAWGLKAGTAGSEGRAEVIAAAIFSPPEGTGGCGTGFLTVVTGLIEGVGRTIKGFKAGVSAGAAGTGMLRGIVPATATEARFEMSLRGRGGGGVADSSGESSRT